MLRVMRFSVIAMFEVDCRTIFRKTGLFLKAEMTCYIADCVEKLGFYRSVRSYASMTVTSTVQWEERESTVL